MPPVEETTTNVKTEEGQVNLTSDQEQAILDEVLAERAKEEGQKDDAGDWKNPADEEAAAAAAAAQEGETEEEKAAKAEADKKAADEKAAADKKVADDKAAADKAAADAAAKKVPEGETEEQKTARLAKEESDKKAAAAGGQTFKIPDEERQQAITDLALKESLTLKEAEEQIAKDEATVNKYQKNPLEMAKALRHAQAEMDRAKAALATTQKAASKLPAPVYANVREFVESQLEPIKDKLIEAYCKENPEVTDGMEPDRVYGLIKKDALDKAFRNIEDNEKNLIASATNKRAELIQGLAEVDKAFIPDIKAALDRTHYRQLLAKDFDVKELIYWAKGRQMDRLLKEAEEKGFKRGQENATIIGKKTPASGGGQAPKAVVKSAASRLSDEQKERAKDMFDTIEGMNDEDKYAAFIDTYPELFRSQN